MGLNIIGYWLYWFETYSMFCRIYDSYNFKFFFIPNRIINNIIFNFIISQTWLQVLYLTALNIAFRSKYLYRCEILRKNLDFLKILSFFVFNGFLRQTEGTGIFRRKSKLEILTRGKTRKDNVLEEGIEKEDEERGECKSWKGKERSRLRYSEMQ